MRKRHKLLMITLLTAAAFAPPADAQDAAAGQRLARRWCSACHEIGNTPVQNDVSPSFTAIARVSSTTRMSLNAFLSTPHHRMPDYSLTRQEIIDVSTYILSLKQTNTQQTNN